MLDTQLRKLAKRTEILNLFHAIKDGFNFELFENKKDLSKLQHTFLSYLYFYHSINCDIATSKVSEKVLENEIYCDAYAYYRNNMKEEKTEIESGKQREFQGIFSKDNKINFPIEEK